MVTPHRTQLILHFANIAIGNLQSFPSCVRLRLAFFFFFSFFPFSFLNTELMGFRESQWLLLLESGERKENIPFSAGLKIPFGLAPSPAISLLDKSHGNSLKSVVTRRWKIVSMIQGRGLTLECQALVNCARLAAPDSPVKDFESTDSWAAISGDLGWGSRI